MTNRPAVQPPAGGVEVPESASSGISQPDPWRDMAVLRRCQRCDEWRPLAAFALWGKLCKDCIHQGGPRYKPVHRIARMRGIVLTAKARALLAEERVAAA